MAEWQAVVDWRAAVDWPAVVQTVPYGVNGAALNITKKQKFSDKKRSVGQAELR